LKKGLATTLLEEIIEESFIDHMVRKGEAE
jgi:hypothetical protein